MAKVKDAFLMFLLLTASVYVAGDCGSLSGSFHGLCIELREKECNDKCKNEDHQIRGECGDFDFKCWCFHYC
ncbi:hypothetical protein SUGI_0909400 [Cryptomeria japonica]|nr:hypothetical protein SUGI_0909400 [Cryptomeria japonica]